MDKTDKKSRVKLGYKYIAKGRRLFQSQFDYPKDFPKLLI